jgi:hypothetical protein
VMLMVASGREIRLDVLVRRQKPELVPSRLRRSRLTPRSIGTR